MGNNIQTLENIVCFSPIIKIWSARKKLTEGDLKIDGAQLPPAALASLGSKHIFDPSLLNVFKNIRRNVERELEKIGFRFLKGYAVPYQKATEAGRKLKKHQQEFEQTYSNFMKEYESRRDAWIAEFPEYADVLKAAVLTKDEVATRFGFAVQAYKVIGTGNVDLDDCLSGAVNGFTETLLSEIADEARDAFKRSYEGVDSVTQKALRPIRTMREKLDGFLFMDPSIEGIVKHIDIVLAALPKTGKIEGVDLASVKSLLKTLTGLPGNLMDIGTDDDTAVSSSPQKVMPFVGSASSLVDDADDEVGAATANAEAEEDTNEADDGFEVGSICL